MINYFIPIVVTFILIYGIYKRVDIFDTFIEGVKEGMKLSINLFPTIFSMIIAITVITDSGIVLSICNILKPLFNRVGFPTEVLPLVILRSISGSSSLVVLNDLLLNYGADSFIGRLSSVIQGSTDTTIYIISMYFSSIGIRKIKYSLVVGLLADFITVIISFIMIKVYF